MHDVLDYNSTLQSKPALMAHQLFPLPRRCAHLRTIYIHLVFALHGMPSRRNIHRALAAHLRRYHDLGHRNLAVQPRRLSQKRERLVVMLVSRLIRWPQSTICRRVDLQGRLVLLRVDLVHVVDGAAVEVVRLAEAPGVHHSRFVLELDHDGEGSARSGLRLDVSFDRDESMLADQVEFEAKAVARKPSTCGVKWDSAFGTGYGRAAWLVAKCASLA